MFKTSRKRKAQDMLELKKKNLNTYATQFDNAVSAVTGIIDTLTTASLNIDKTIAEIDDYQKELSETAQGLRNTKAKNDRVVQNFKALVAVE